MVRQSCLLLICLYSCETWKNAYWKKYIWTFCAWPLHHTQCYKWEFIFTFCFVVAIKSIINTGHPYSWTKRTNFIETVTVAPRFLISYRDNQAILADSIGHFLGDKASNGPSKSDNSEACCAIATEDMFMLTLLNASDIHIHMYLHTHTHTRTQTYSAWFHFEKISKLKKLRTHLVV